MDGLNAHGLTLFLGHLPERKGLCFYFQVGNEAFPLAYVRVGQTKEAEQLWMQFIGQGPEGEASFET